ncbi:MAG: hypothetical protein A2Y53_03895 [Chloroflexi bacterium RBG_16_47_49]|nr:MAG: hypothetical protein A2Y53_03895 [Chloroflexi bacterium RBG_16_47_49]
MKKSNTIDLKIEYIRTDVDEVKEDIKYIKENFLTRREFNESFSPIRNGFFGLIMLVVTGFLGAIINFFIRQP